MNRYMYVPSKNVAIQNQVYVALSKEKRPGESFTSLFRRLLAQTGAAEELLGSWTKNEGRRGRQILRTLRSAPKRNR